MDMAVQSSSQSPGGWYSQDCLSARTALWRTNCMIRSDVFYWCPPSQVHSALVCVFFGWRLQVPLRCRTVHLWAVGYIRSQINFLAAICLTRGFRNRTAEWRILTFVVQQAMDCVQKEFDAISLQSLSLKVIGDPQLSRPCSACLERVQGVFVLAEW